MTTPPSANGVENSKYSIPLLLALIAAGLAGNYFHFPIFFGIDFLFGSIFAMLALQFLGLGRGIPAAAITAGYTYFLWNHPYAIIIMTCEVAVVGWLMGRRKMGMVLADTLYWLIIGMPLVYLFYRITMHLPFSTTYIAMTKQAVNGIANALAARLIFTGYALRWLSSLTSYREIVYNLLAFFVLCPALIIMAVGSRTDFNETDRHIRTTLIQDSLLVNHRLKTWVMSRKSAIVNLAEMSASRSPQQMQSCLEQAKKSDANFQRVGLLDREAITTAFYPLLDGLGQKIIGTNFADRPFIAQLKNTLKPMLSEVYMSRFGIPKPVVSMLAPVVIRGAYGGYVIGVLSLQQLQDYLDKSSHQNVMFYTLLDKNGNVIMSNRADQKVMTSFVRGKGTLNHLDNGISQWVPVVPPNTPVAERWKKSFYVAESTIGDLAEWRLILEQPVAPFQKMLYDNYTGKFTLLFLILLMSLALAKLVSSNIVVTLEKLGTLTHDLPVRLATDGKKIAWPESGIKEANSLIDNFREMAASLTAQFNEVRQINESLEHRVKERTNQLTKTMHELNIILENAPVGITKTIDRKQVWVSRKAEELFLYSKEEMEFQPNRKLYPSDEAYEKLGHEAYPILAQGLVFETVQDLVRKDGVHILVRCIGKAIDPPDLSKGTIWLLEDITERRRAEQSLAEKQLMLEELNKSLEKRVADALLDLRQKDQMFLLQSRQAAMGEMIGNIAHQWRQPLNMLGLIVQELPVMFTCGKLSKEYLDADASKAMELIQHMSKTIDDFRNFFRPDKEKVLFNVNQIVIKTLALIEQSFKTVNIQVQVNVVNDAVIDGYPNEFSQVLLNIINNARDVFVERQIERARVITITIITENNRAVVIISDNAGGIPEEVMSKIFEPYFTTKGPDKGTGVGLYMAKNIIEKNMGGRLEVRNIADGAEFRIEV